MKKTILSAFLLLNAFLNSFSQNCELIEVIKNEKIKNYSVTVYRIPKSDEANSRGVILIKNNDNQSINMYNIKEADFSKLKSAKKFIGFEDFNFDNKDEILIYDEFDPYDTPIGFYIYDSETGEALNYFTSVFDFEEKEKKENSNYIFTYRGSYEINKEEKTIKITGSCGAMCGIEEIYKFTPSDDTNVSEEDRGKYHLIEKKEWQE